MQHHLEDLLNHAKIAPMVNQVEFHPHLVQQDLLDFCKANGIQYEAWSPIMKGRVKEIPEMKELARKYNKTEVQIVLRWDLQKGVITIPKSSREDRIQSNADIFDFNLTDEDMVLIDGLDKNHRIGPDPSSTFILFTSHGPSIACFAFNPVIFSIRMRLVKNSGI